MRLSLTAFLLLQHVFEPCDANPLKLLPRATTERATPVVVTTTRDGSTYKQTYSPTVLTAYATATGPTTITTTNDAGKAILIGIFAGGLAWVGVGLAGAGPKFIPPPPTPPPGPPPPPEPDTPKDPDDDGPKETTSTYMNNKPAQTATFNIKKKEWKKYDVIFEKPIHAPYEMTNCAEASGPTVDRSRAVDKIKGFCKQYKDKKVDDKGFEEAPDMGRGIVLSLSAKLNPICPAKLAHSLRQGDCEWLLKACLDNCDTKSQKKHGSIVKDGCQIWGAVAQEYEGDLECQKERRVDGDLGVKREYLRESIKDFCGNFADKSVKPKSPFRREYFYETGNSAATLEVAYNSDECSADKIPEYDVDKAACERFLTKAVDGCDTNTQTAKYGGSVGDHCGVFRLKTRNVEKVYCGASDRPGPTTMSRQAALEAIPKLCGPELEVDPDYKYNDEFSQYTPDGYGRNTVVVGNIAINMQAGWTGEKDCPKPKRFKMVKEDCERKLKTILDDCDTKTTSKKHGGSLLDKTPHGCVLWVFDAQKATND
ncbi:predicted protein [Uncinocarpus reesii 1704]|uniref:Uncharacterized protein n=1 Tax=Uncinocarpus reesii (strain UAMH 1704) TaxID=336963 RepID=C4JKZ8_UNCRE|nr:uncharacterized protein UREG_00213 [Uncinocarpus reesii 1704]EEP75367.1 predicted protein [Uncinocarpus reesii 1704]